MTDGRFSGAPPALSEQPDQAMQMVDTPSAGPACRKLGHALGLTAPNRD